MKLRVDLAFANLTNQGASVDSFFGPSATWGKLQSGTLHLKLINFSEH